MPKGVCQKGGYTNVVGKSHKGVGAAAKVAQPKSQNREIFKGMPRRNMNKILHKQAPEVKGKTKGRMRSLGGSANDTGAQGWYNWQRVKA